MLALSGLLVWSGLCSQTPAWGQETPPAEAGPGKPGDTTIPKPSDWERLVYIPYKNLKQVFEKEGAAVFMPYAQFLKMWEKTRTLDPQAGTRTPVSAVVSEALYSGKISGDVAQLEVQLTVQVLGKPWVEVPIQFGDAAIGKMTASDDKTLLQATGNGTYTLLFAKAGEHKVKLELSARVRTSPDGRSLELDCPAAGITRFNLTVPAADQTIEVNPAAIVSPVPGDEKSTQVSAQLGATKRITARWRPRLSTAPVMEVLATVQNTLDVRIADGLVHTHATLVYQVLRGQIDQVRIGVPVDHRILDVTGAGLKSWKAVKEEKLQVLTVDLLGGDAKSISLEVHTERPVPDGPVELAGIDEAGTYRGIHALGELRENGTLIVGQAADLSLTVQEQSGLVRVEPSEVPEPLRRAEAQYYKYYTPKIRLQTAVKPVEPRILADQRTQVVFRDDELQLTSQSTLLVEKAGVFELRFKLPDGLKVDRVDCEQMKEFQAPEGENLLIVVLREKSQGQLVVNVTGHKALDSADKEAFPLPLLTPEGTARETGQVLVYAPESLEVIADESGVQGAQSVRPEGNVAPQLGTSRLLSAWSYTRHPEIPVRTERKPTRLTATIGTTINVRQDLTEVNTLVTYQVQFAGLDTFRLAVPEAFAAQVQIDSADPAGLPLKQKSRDENAEDGWVTWTVVTQREVTGRVPLRVRYDLKPDVVDKSRKLEVEPVRVLPTPGKTADAPPVALAGVSGELTVQKDRSLSVDASGDEFEPIDVRELTLLPQDGNLAYRYFKQPEAFSTAQKLSLTATQHEIQEVVETVVAQAFVEAVLTEDKIVTFRCRYRLKTSERQRLSIDLPKDVEILDSFVAGKRVELEKDAGKATAKDRDAFRINVSRATPSDVPFVMALLFRAPFKENPLHGHGGNLQLHFPHLGGSSDQGHAAVAIQQLKVALWVPKEFTLVGQPPDFHPEFPTYLNLKDGAVAYSTSTSQLENWFQDSSSTLFAFTPAGRAYTYTRLGAADTIEVSYWRINWYTWVISGTLLLIALVLSRTSWENRLTFVLLLVFGGAMWALRDAD
ncbi:MAG: hypothetical protein JSS02_04850, partial [Planctomycetes bacterium]|nr:hypothetical protein [Planctomycetota bacterium]